MATRNDPGSGLDVSRRVACTWGTEELVRQSDHADTLRANSSLMSLYSGSGNDCNFEGRMGVSRGNSVPLPCWYTPISAMSPNARIDSAPHGHHRSNISSATSLAASLSLSSAELLDESKDTWGSTGYDFAHGLIVHNDVLGDFVVLLSTCYTVSALSKMLQTCVSIFTIVDLGLSSLQYSWSHQ